jgi:putative ABC transport system permease protein
VRHGVRGLRTHSGFAALAIASLARGIGANTAIFSAFDGRFLGALPYPDPQRLVFVNETDVARDVNDLSVAAIDADLWREHSTAFVNLAGFLEGGWSLSGFGDAVASMQRGRSASGDPCWAWSR